MGKISIPVAGILLVVLGFILTLGIIDWLIDITGVLLIIIGAVLLLFSLAKVFFGGNKGGGY